CDSRVILAAAFKAGINVTTFTFEKPITKMTLADKLIPRKLSKKLGYKHVKINRNKFSSNKLTYFDKHSSQMIPGIDRLYYSYSQFDRIPKTVFLIMGGMFAVGNCYYYGKLDPDIENAKRSIFNTFSFEKNHSKSVAHKKGVENWIKWIRGNKEVGIDWRDRFYYDFRIGSWLGSVEQALDITKIERIHLANNHNIMSALLSIPVDIRRKEKHMIDLINRMAPQISKYPINKKDPIIIKLIRKILK